jgi:hypothetical protein
MLSNLLNQLAEEKPPCRPFSLDGEKNSIRSFRCVNTSPTSGKLQHTYAGLSWTAKGPHALAGIDRPSSIMRLHAHQFNKQFYIQEAFTKITFIPNEDLKRL